MKKYIPAFGFGFIFAIGLGAGGMTQPQKIIGFLDIFGDWDPALAWVMAGAVAVYAALFKTVVKRSSTVCGDKFVLPTKTEIDRRLIIGSVLFGAGWGLAGYCPAPAVTSLVSMQGDVFYFVGAMMAGMALFKVQEQLKQKRAEERQA